jgi:putative PIN family toxin of toxin-antitoxin system
MKIVFDTNVYVAEALLGQAAEAMIDATLKARWRVFVSDHILVEVQRVLAEKLKLSRRFAAMTRHRVARRCVSVEPSESRHRVAADADDTPVLRTALAAGVDYLVTNDQDLLQLDPYEGLRIISMDDYSRLLRDRGLLA